MKFVYKKDVENPVKKIIRFSAENFLEVLIEILKEDSGDADRLVEHGRNILGIKEPDTLAYNFGKDEIVLIIKNEEIEYNITQEQIERLARGD